MSSWVLFTVFAALMQAIRTAGQKQLTSSLTTMSSTLARYVFGWPFVLLYLYFILRSESLSSIASALQLNRFVVYAAPAAVAQIVATFLLVKTFSYRNFAVGTSFAKTEAVQAAAFGTVFFGSALSWIGWLAVLVGFVGILIVSVPAKKMPWQPMNILFGTLSGACFAITSLWVREASLSLGLGVLESAAITLFCIVSFQALICLIYSVIKEPGQLALIGQRKGLALFVGATSALGSIGWFTAMTYTNPALVKSLGQVEFIFTLMLTTLFFKESITRREFVGVLAITISVILLLAPVGALRANDSKTYRQFPAPNANFVQHIKELDEFLRATQMPQRTAEDVQFNLPFELVANSAVPYRGKFLLIHGLNDSPYVWRDVASDIAKKGFDVRAILLPGHGNSPRAQLGISYKAWIRAARNHAAIYREPGKPFYLGGFSLGGVIATLLAAESSNVDGLLLFSPAYHSKLNHLLRWAGIYSVIKPWVFDGMIIEDNPTKYNSIPINGASQYYKTTRVLKRRWPKKALDIPVLMIASRNDSVIDIGYIERTFKKGFVGDKKLIVYDNEKATTVHTSSTASIEYRNSRYIEKRVLNQSHQSLLLSKANPLFGENGKVLVCNGNEWSVFSACLRYPGSHWFGAQHTPSPDGVPVARATYNPDYDYIMDQFDKVFIQ